MPSIKQPAKKRKPLGKSGAGKISNAELLKLAGRRRPPQQWYDEEIDPTKPASGNGRGK